MYRTLLPEIKAMLSEGRSQREIAEHLGLRDKNVVAELLQSQQERCRQTYGYRRMWLWLEKQGIHHDPKTVLRVMKKYNILAEIRRPRKWVQMGLNCPPFVRQ